MNHSGFIFQQLFDHASSTYTYLLADKQTKEAVLIDTVIEMVDRDLKLVDELGLKLKYILDTHVHADHVTGAGEIRKRTGAKAASAKAANVPCADLKLIEGDALHFGPFVIRVLETPGHTDASLSFVFEDRVFTGDALLIRGCGRTDFQSGSAESLYESVHQKLFSLPPETIVYPAHDYQGFTSSTIEAELKWNPRLGQGKTKIQFQEIMAALKLDYPKKMDIALPANLTCGVAATQTNASIPSISAEDVQKNERETLLIDVRREDEFNGELGHIKGAHLITLGPQLENFLSGFDRSERLIFVCRSGQRSSKATAIALEMGFSNALNLDGGMLRWNECAFPVVKGQTT